MWFKLVGSLLPYAIDVIVRYIQSSDSSKDDKVLSIVKVGADYLAKKDNNDITIEDSKNLMTKKFKG